MGRRDLLSADERAKLFGIPAERDALARCYSFGPSDLALMRHPGLTLGQILARPGTDMTPLVEFVAEQLELPASGFGGTRVVNNSHGYGTENARTYDPALIVEVTREWTGKTGGRHHDWPSPR